MKLLFFAQCADWMDMRELKVDLAAPARLEDFLTATPALAPLLERRNSFKVAVNRSFADPDTEVHHGDEVAFLPPFSGG